MESSAFQFIVAMIISLVGYTAWSFRGQSVQDVKDYFKTKTGLGILKGIVLAIGLTTVIAMCSGCSSGTYFNDATVYAGLESTRKVSPQCEPTGVNSKLTSNLGVKVNLFESSDGKFRNNFKYTHHSCALSPDDKQYDAVGTEFEYKFYVR